MAYKETLKRVRKLMGLTQAELAERCGVSQSCISMIESGERLPTKTIVDNMSKELGYKLDHRDVGIDYLVSKLYGLSSDSIDYLIGFADYLKYKDDNVLS